MSNNPSPLAAPPSDPVAELLAVDRNDTVRFTTLVLSALAVAARPGPLFHRGVVVFATFPVLLNADERVELVIGPEPFDIEPGMMVMGAYPIEDGAHFGPIHVVPPVDGDETVRWDLFGATGELLEADSVVIAGRVVALRGPGESEESDWWGILSNRGVRFGITAEGRRTIALGDGSRWINGDPDWRRER